ncbi:hypothetical protein ACQP2X_29000 [Actinoplanes sp. CA-131856]
MLAETGLGLSIVCAGLWSGLLLTLTTILHPIYAAEDGRGFARQLRAFLPTARRSPTNYALVGGLVLAPVLALIGLRGDASGAPFVLTAVGLALTVAGPLLVSNRLSEPLYDVILGWDPEAVPAGWQRTRGRYFTLNWIRAMLTWAAFALFLSAAFVHATWP